MTFKQFSDSAKLYAENWAVVEAMKSAFDQSVDEFIEAVEGEVRQMADGLLQHKVTSSYRYWWLGDDGVERDAYPQLWFHTRLADIVEPGLLKLTAIAPTANAEQLVRLTALVEDPSIKDICSVGTGGPWSLFLADVTYPDADVVNTAARKVTALLHVLDRTWHASSSK